MIKRILFVCILLYSTGILWSQSYKDCYFIADSGDDVYKFNKHTGTVSLIGSLTSSGVEAGTLNLDGDSMFAFDNSMLGYIELSGTSAGKFNKINDLSSSTIQGAGGTVTVTDIDAMTMGIDGILWAVTSDEHLIRVKPGNGNVVNDFFGSGADYLAIQVPAKLYSSTAGSWFVDALAMDPTSNEVYALINSGSSVPRNHIFRLNTSTGVAEFIGNAGVGDIEGLGFDKRGVLYGTTGTGAPIASNKNSIFSIDKSSGQATKLYSLSGYGGDYEACDCITGRRNHISVTTFHDADQDGSQDMDEAAYRSTDVELWIDADANGVVSVGDILDTTITTSSKDGTNDLYLLYENSIDYVFRCAVSQFPSGSQITTSSSYSFSFNDDENSLSFNFGVYSGSNTMGVVLFNDLDQDEVFDDGTEIPTSSIDVILYEDQDCNGVYNAGSDLQISTATTDIDGEVEFIVDFTKSYSRGSFQRAVSKSAGDASEASSSVTTNGTNLVLGQDIVGLHFENIDVPQNAVIDSAIIRLEADASGSEINIVSVDINNVDDAAEFSSSELLSTRTLTGNEMDWSMAYWRNNFTYPSISFDPLLEHVVSRNGWERGNSVAFIIDEEHSGLASSPDYRTANSFDAGSSPQLVVHYSLLSANSCFLVGVDEESLPVGAALTGDNYQAVSFSSGGTTADVEIGHYTPPGAVNVIRGQLFQDLDGDNLKDADEIAASGELVKIYRDLGCDGELDSDDALFSQVSTNSDGEYELETPFTTNSRTQTVTFKVTHSQDDVEEDPSAGTIVRGGTILNLSAQGTGLRFDDFEIPEGATINSAKLKFKAQSNRTSATSLDVFIENEAYSNRYLTSTNHVSLRDYSSNSISWKNVESWFTNEYYYSPDLATLVESVINSSSYTWTSGNALSIYLENGTGERTAYSYDRDANEAPSLEVSYLGNVCYLATYPSMIDESFTSTARDTVPIVFSSGGVNEEVDKVYTFDAAAFNAVKAKVFYDANNNGLKESGEVYLDGFEMALYEDDDCNEAIGRLESLLENQLMSNAEVNFDREYEGYVNKSFTQQISSSTNDADVSSSTMVSGSVLDFVQQGAGLRFTNVTIPQGAKINSAKVYFTSQAIDIGRFSVFIYGNLESSPLAFSSGDNLENLSKTDASVFWVARKDWSPDIEYSSADISVIIQELVDQGTWSSGNSIKVLFLDGQGERDAYSFDGSSGKAPRLMISWRDGNAAECYNVSPDLSSAPNASISTSSVLGASFSSGNSEQELEFGIVLDDWDADGIPNLYDIDSDNDGILDVIELCGIGATTFSCLTLGQSPFQDHDADGILNYKDANFCTLNGAGVCATMDADGDGWINSLDLDADNDGIPDLIEAQTTIGLLSLVGNDFDEDGLDDRFDGDCTATPPCNSIGNQLSPLDFESDNTPDYLDLDSDDDGSSDWTESMDANADGKALDDLRTFMANYISNGGSATDYPDVARLDQNADGVEDWIGDDDADGVPNYLDSDHSSFYHDANENGLVDLFDPEENGTVVVLPNTDGLNDKDFRDDGTNGVPLPVTWVNVSKKCLGGNRVLVTWKVAQEVNVKDYRIEFSTDLISWKTLSVTEVGQSSVLEKTYKKNISLPEEQNNFIRIVETDLLGGSSFSKVITVDCGIESSNGKTFAVPNPAKDKFKVVGLSLKGKRVKVYDSSGQLVEVEHSDSDNTLVIKDPNPGLYVVVLSWGNDMEMLKVIVQ